MSAPEKPSPEGWAFAKVASECDCCEGAQFALCRDLEQRLAAHFDSHVSPLRDKLLASEREAVAQAETVKRLRKLLACISDWTGPAINFRDGKPVEHCGICHEQPGHEDGCPWPAIEYEARR